MPKGIDGGYVMGFRSKSTAPESPEKNLVVVEVECADQPTPQDRDRRILTLILAPTVASGLIRLLQQELARQAPTQKH